MVIETLGTAAALAGMAVSTVAHIANHIRLRSLEKERKIQNAHNIVTAGGVVLLGVSICIDHHNGNKLIKALKLDTDSRINFMQDELVRLDTRMATNNTDTIKVQNEVIDAKLNQLVDIAMADADK